NYTQGSYNYVFNYTDHLGNVRLSYGLDSQTHVLTILEENNYYSFGLKHTNYNNTLILWQSNANNMPALLPVAFNNLVPSLYNYKYNGKELQDELGLNIYDYGARNYDPAIGRWFNIDPKSELMPNQSPYNYALNSPILFVDPDGALPWPIHIRSFISASSVGGGTFRGDGRGPSTQNSPYATSRVESRFTVDPAKGRVSNPVSRSDATLFYGAGNPANGPYIPPMVETPQPTSSIKNISKANNALSLDFAHSAKDPITPGVVTPDLDVQGSLDIIENLEGGMLSVTGRFTGDAFPSTEAFITDQSGKTNLLLGAHKEEGGLPNLFGENKRPTFTVNMIINIDKSGNFTGVSQGDKNYTVDEWNNQVKKSF
ncbi:RHS repeat domain-containing protein, partial [Flavobacterium sp. '19STA2R22 D10 B1']|uniref:RHS repeat domain-containing protein n=1 Tax=Flavobacterium aerium TaxID=3037261 RepID=UPI00278C1351